MKDAGFARGEDGFYASATEGRFTPEAKVEQSTQSERELSIMAAVWKQNGFDFLESVLPAGLITDGQARSTFGTLETTGGGWGERLLSNIFHTSRIPGPGNRWAGSNRGAWSNAEFDRLAEAFETTLDPTERAQGLARMLKLVTEELPAASIYQNIDIVAFAHRVGGPQPVVREAEVSWDVYRWQATD